MQPICTCLTSSKVRQQATCNCMYILLLARAGLVLRFATSAGARTCVCHQGGGKRMAAGPRPGPKEGPPDQLHSNNHNLRLRRRLRSSSQSALQAATRLWSAGPRVQLQGTQHLDSNEGALSVSTCSSHRPCSELNQATTLLPCPRRQEGK